MSHEIDTLTISYDGVIVGRNAMSKIVAGGSTRWLAYRDATNVVLFIMTWNNLTRSRIGLKQLDFGA